MSKSIKSPSVVAIFAFVLLALGAATPAARADSVVSDPVGDTFGTGAVQHDITSVSATYTSTTLTFNVNFAGSIFAPSGLRERSVIGFIDIDADRNPLTGADSATAFFAPPPSPSLGVEYGIDLSLDLIAPGYVEVYDAVTGIGVGIAPIVFSTNSLSISVPLALIGGNGFVNYAVVFGTFDEPTDKAPNGATPAMSAAAVPEPTSLLLLGTGLAGVGATLKRRRSRRSATGVPPPLG